MSAPFIKSKLEAYVENNYDIDDVYYQIFGKHIPSGKVFCPNPLHDNHNTPAAKRYGNAIHCFVCQRSFSPYHLFKWYSPSSLQEIKSSILLPQSTPESQERIIKHDKSLFKGMSVSQIISKL